jgi:predicted dithiol-disulfide oxidoreductase (DUF899 family)
LRLARSGSATGWYSSADSDFNYDFHVTVDDRVTLVLLNYRNETELAEYGTADRSGGGPREPLQDEDLSRDSSTGSAGFAARSGGKVGRRHAGRMAGRPLHKFDPVAVGVG